MSDIGQMIAVGAKLYLSIFLVLLALVLLGVFGVGYWVAA